MANLTITESSGLVDSIFGDSQAPIRLTIEKKAEACEENSMLPFLFSMDRSKHFGEKFTTLTAMDGFAPVGENGNYPEDSMQEGYSKFLEHMTWKDSFSLSRELVEDSISIDLRKKPTAFVAGYYRTRERFGAALFAAAMSGASTASFGGKSFDVNAADGEKLFSAAHPSKVAGGNQSNIFSDVFSADALAAAECAMQNFKGDNGEVLNIAPDTIVIPNDYALKKEVFSVIGADKDPATANNGFNYQFGRWNVIVWPYLNSGISGKPWMLIDSNYNNEYGGAVWLDRTDLDVRSTIDDNTDANVWYGYARFIAGFNDWRFACVGGAADGTALIQ